jgi:hypothetical protein
VFLLCLASIILFNFTDIFTKPKQPQSHTDFHSNSNSSTPLLLNENDELQWVQELLLQEGVRKEIMNNEEKTSYSSARNGL